MNSMAVVDLEFALPIAFGLFIMIISMGLKLKKDKVSIFFDKNKSDRKEVVIPLECDRSKLMSKMSYDNLILNGKFLDSKDAATYLECARLFGFVDVRDMAITKSMPFSITQLSVFVSDIVEVTEYLSKSSKESGFLLLYMSISNFDVRLIY